MLAKLKRSWHSLKKAPAGERFRQAYRKNNDADRPVWKRVAWIALAVVILAAGIVALPAPGPGTLVIVVGLAIIARELAWVARALDRLELWIRRTVAAARRTWRNASPLGKVGLATLAGVVGLALLAGAAWTAYRVMLN